MFDGFITGRGTTVGSHWDFREIFLLTDYIIIILSYVVIFPQIVLFLFFPQVVLFLFFPQVYPR